MDIPFEKGIMSFAGSGKDSRGTQIFITLGEVVPSLGKAPWETPFGKVIDGMNELEKNLYFGYGDETGPDQGKIWKEGYSYLEREFPELTYIKSCKIL